MSDVLDVPEFLRRKKEGGVTSEETNEVVHDNSASEEPVTLDRLLATIKELAEKRDKITATISALKKRVQKMVGQL